MKRKRDPKELEELLARGRAARQQMQEIIDRVDARMQERAARRERSILRRLLSR
jgi:DNA-binding MarR family transcriptional regulator